MQTWERLTIAGVPHAVIRRCRGRAQAVRLAAEKGCKWTYLPGKGFLAVAEIDKWGMAKMATKGV
jgi:hypothetical protein